MTNLADGHVNIEWSRGLAESDLGCEVPGKISIGEVRLGSAVESEGHLGDDIATAMGRVEDATAIGEAAGSLGEIEEGKRLKVKRPNRVNGACNLLPIGSNVLNRATADGAGDASQAFDSANSLLADLEDKSVPVAACGYDDVDRSVCVLLLHRSIHSKVKDQTFKSSIADKEITASPKRENLESTFARKVHCFEKLRFGVDFAEETGRAADPKGSVVSERNVLLNVKCRGWHGLMLYHLGLHMTPHRFLTLKR